jgi:hypothetical protein
VELDLRYEILMKTVMKNIFRLLIIFVLFISCERDSDTLGPNLNDLFAPLEIIEPFQVSGQRADFGAGQTLEFSAMFNKQVDWEIHIVGQNSGATKILSGKSNFIDASNGVWDGSTTNLPMFKQEACVATLMIQADSFSADIQPLIVTGLKENEGFVVADFENGKNPGWEEFVQSGANMTFNIVEDITAGEKNHYYDMGGRVDFDFLIGLIEFPASAYDVTHFPLDQDPGRVFHNVMFNKPEGITNNIIIVEFYEDDNMNGTIDRDANGGLIEDLYLYEIRGTDMEDGWQLISTLYEDLGTPLVNGIPAPPSGNGVFEPQKLISIRLLFLADPTSGYSQTLMDYMMFTEFEALNP